LFHLHSDQEAVWGGLLIIFAFVLVTLLVIMATLNGWQLPTIQPSWNGDFLKPLPTPFGSY